MHHQLLLFAAFFIALRFWVFSGLSFWALAVHLVYLVVGLILIIYITFVRLGNIWLILISLLLNLDVEIYFFLRII